MSMTAQPGRSRASTPPGPSRTSSTIGRVRQHREDDVAVVGDRRAARRGPRAERFERPHRRGIDVEDDERKALADEIRRHGTSHVAESDETDPIHAVLLKSFIAQRRGGIHSRRATRRDEHGQGRHDPERGRGGRERPRPLERRAGSIAGSFVARP